MWEADIMAISVYGLSTTAASIFIHLIHPSTPLTDSRYIPSDDVLANIC